MNITLPELALVILVGASGSGKSTFAAANFLPSESVSSDFCRKLISDDENNQSVSSEAFDLLHTIISKRLTLGKLTVVDATNVQPEARKPLLELARKYHCIPCAIVFDYPEKICRERNNNRSDRNFGNHVITRQTRQMKQALRSLKKEGFRHVFVLKDPSEAENVEITRQPLWNNRKSEHGPFDVIGDIHGCYDELLQLFDKLGYQVLQGENGRTIYHPDNRKPVFLGDYCDRGPKIAETLRLIMEISKGGNVFCVPGNHDKKLIKALSGRNVTLNHGLQNSMDQLSQETEEFRQEVSVFLDSLVSHYVLDEGRLVVAHAGMKEEMQGRGSGKVRDFALYGETTGETDEYGLPVRYNWAADYRGSATVVYGHTPVPEPAWLNKTICVDTGCVFGGNLTALRWPEKEIVSVPALKMYYEPAKPLIPIDSPENKPVRYDGLPEINDVMGNLSIETKLHHRVNIREENGRAALEAMSRYAADPRWLIYLPPTMSPAETAAEPGYLEFPHEALAYYAKNNVEKVVCEQKHMGSRAVVIVCRNRGAAERRFGIDSSEPGIIYTRTGRRFFEDVELETLILNRINNSLEKSGIWDEFETDWLCLDCELMPWSLKARELLRQQYAAVGASSSAASRCAVESLEKASERGLDVSTLLEKYSFRLNASELFRKAYGNYCWKVDSIEDVKIAPFHILAGEKSVYTHKDHVWHMEKISAFCSQDPSLLLATPYRIVDLSSEESISHCIEWWKTLTENGGEGMVVKPFDFTAHNGKSIIQPAVKCRGREYLRLIYGPEYTLPDNLERLRARGLSVKRRLALQEFALGIESLQRFVNGEPLYRYHQCAFAVLALESEPVDPRL
ncbi:MAG: polynucleotide kinase-phosphatase [Firmicutes bacterium]|nr:polynucleotide kinase-phosphatase [Bacillota bacterium]